MGNQVLDFGTTGLLRFSNLVMYDRQTESWWQEFTGEAAVGDMTGTQLELLPLSIVSWKEFKSTFPQGKVLSQDTGFSRPYGRNPYLFYDTSSPFLFYGPQDGRLPAIERVVGIEMGTESLAVPYSVLSNEPIIHLTLGGQPMVIFFKPGTASTLDSSDIAEGRDVGAVGVFDPKIDGQQLTFRREGDLIIDDQTGSTWNLLGKAESGPLAGKSLRPVLHRAAQFWFSWAVSKPDTQVYEGK